MKDCVSYIIEAKAAIGDRRMSDRAFGEHLRYSQQAIAKAKTGKMSDPLAMKIADLLKIDRGEVLMVARLERENDAAVRKALKSYAGKIFGLVSARAAGAFAVLAVALGLSMFPRDAHAVGGVGRFRP